MCIDLGNGVELAALDRSGGQDAPWPIVQFRAPSTARWHPDPLAQ